MKGKIIILIAVFIIICSIQTTTAFEENNSTQNDFQLNDIGNLELPDNSDSVIQTESINIKINDVVEEPTVGNSKDTVKELTPPRLNVTVVSDGDDFVVGEQVTVTITVTNLGEQTATNIFVDSYDSPGHAGFPYPALERGKSVKFVLKNALKKGTYTYVASVTCSENTTPVSDSATVTFYDHDLKINKAANATSVLVDDLVNFTIVIRNHGNKSVTNVNIHDVLDDSFEFVSAGGNYTRDNQTVVWNIDKLLAEEDSSVWVVGRVKNNGTFDNVALVNCAEESTLKKDVSTIKALMPSVNVTKSLFEDYLYVGDEATFKIIITNDGEIKLHNIVVNEIIPEGLIYDHFIGSDWTKNGTEFCYGGSLDIGESIELIVVVNTTKFGDFTNYVEVSADNLNIHKGSADITVYGEEITLIKVSDKQIVDVGELVTFTITVINSGNSVLNDIEVVDELPDGLEFVSFAGNGWDKEDNCYLYHDSLLPGESISFAIVCTATKVANITNVAVVFLDSGGNVSDSVNVSIINETKNDTQSVTPGEPILIPMGSNVAGNPIMFLLLIIFALMPLKIGKK